jgi:peptide-methionine (S)-S-oxide reductase
MEKIEKAILGGGCFWCLEAVYQLVEGVTNIRSGYSGGQNPNPTYEEVCNGTTGHAEVVEISFDASKLSYKDVLTIFFDIHDPTTLNRQGNDTGTQYRSVIFYLNDIQKTIAEESISQIAQSWKNPIVTEVQKLVDFFEAEAYHHDYYRRNPGSSYCYYVVKPKVEKFLKKKST